MFLKLAENQNRGSRLIKKRKAVADQLKTQKFLLDNAGYWEKNLRLYEVIYIRGCNSVDLELAIQEHYSEIRSLFAGQGLLFFYATKDLSFENSSFNEWMQYKMPHLNQSELARIQEVVNKYGEEKLFDYILSKIPTGCDVKGGLLYCNVDRGNYYISLNQVNPQGFLNFLHNVADVIAGERFYGPRFKRTGRQELNTTEYDIDESFDYEAHCLAQEIKDKIENLNKQGFSHLLHGILMEESKIISKKEHGIIGLFQPILSRIEITPDYRLLLPEYGKEIEMTPLPKAVYLLFLRHKEGIFLKEISKYREELMSIYQELSGRESLTEIRKSIENITDPSNNSLNEKCSRIKEAFVKLMNEDLAHHYYITGSRGERKMVLLPQELVVWKTGTINPQTAISNSPLSLPIKEMLEKGGNAYKKREYYQSLYYYTQILERLPHHVEALMKRALNYSELGLYGFAVADNTSAIHEAPKDADIAYHNRSEALMMLGRYDEALVDMTYYIQTFDHRCRESYYIRGLIQMNLGNITSACQDWYNALTLGHPRAATFIKRYPEVEIKNTQFEKAE